MLVTPVERVGITVDDAPFLAVEMAVDGEGDRPADRVPHQCGRSRPGRAPSTLALRARPPRRRQTLRAGAGRPLGAGDPRARPRPRRPRRGAGRRRAGHVRGRGRRDVLSDRAGARSSDGARMTARLRSRRRDFLALARRAAARGAARPRGRPGRSARRPHPRRPAARRARPDPKPAAVLVPVVLREPEPAVLLTERAASPAPAFGPDRLSGRTDRSRTTARSSTAACGRPRRRSASRAASCVRSAISTPICRELELPRHARGRAGRARLHARRSIPTRSRPPSRCPLTVPDGRRQPPAPFQRSCGAAERRYYAMPYGERYIWGVTAGIIRNLYERLYGP